MLKKRKSLMILVVALCSIIMIGVFTMTKKTVKQEQFSFQEINSITLNADNADVNVSLTDDTDIIITQFSVKKVDETFAYDMTVDNSNLTITDNAKEVSWLFGIKGSAGISYDLQIPKAYAQSLNINIGTGNVEYSGQDSHTFSSFNIIIGVRGNINMYALGLVGNSQIITNSGDIDITLNNQTSCIVTGKLSQETWLLMPDFQQGKSL